MSDELPNVPGLEIEVEKAVENATRRSKRGKHANAFSIRFLLP